MSSDRTPKYRQEIQQVSNITLMYSVLSLYTLSESGRDGVEELFFDYGAPLYLAIVLSARDSSNSLVLDLMRISFLLHLDIIYSHLWKQQ